MRIYTVGSDKWVNAVSLLSFPKAKMKVLLSLMNCKAKNGSFLFVMFNRYYWLVVGDCLLLLETYDWHDPACKDMREKICNVFNTVKVTSKKSLQNSGTLCSIENN